MEGEIAKETGLSLRIIIPWIIAIGTSIAAYVQWVLSRGKREIAFLGSRLARVANSRAACTLPPRRP